MKKILVVVTFLTLLTVNSFSQERESIDVIKMEICHTPLSSKFRVEPHLADFKKKKDDFCDEAFFQLTTTRIPREIDTKKKLLYYLKDEFLISYSDANPIIRGKVTISFNDKSQSTLYIIPEGYFIYNSKFYKNNEFLTILLQYFDDSIRK